MKCPKCGNEFTGQPASCPSCGQPFAWQTAPTTTTPPPTQTETASASTTTVPTESLESSNWLDKYAFFIRYISVIPIIGTIIAFMILHKHKDYKKSLDAHRRLSYKTMRKATYINTAVWLVIIVGIIIITISFRNSHA